MAIKVKKMQKNVPNKLRSNAASPAASNKLESN